MAVMFLKIPENYDSVCDDLVYTIAGFDAGRIVDVEIFTNGEATPMAVKRFRGGGDIDVNVAGLLRRYIAPKPIEPVVISFKQDAGRSVKVSVRCGGMGSFAKMITCAVRALSVYETLTLLPLRRSIWWDESDEISVLSRVNSVLTYVVTLNGRASFKLDSGRVGVPDGILSFSLSMKEMADKARAAGYDRTLFDSMQVEINNGNQNLSRIGYDIRQRDGQSIRLCWLNPLGGMDYHTFKCAMTERTTITKDTFINNGMLRSCVSKTDDRIEVTSGYMPCSWIDGLANILSSPLVWRVDGTDFIEMDVLPVKVEITDGKPNILTFEIRDTAKKKIQKF